MQDVNSVYTKFPNLLSNLPVYLQAGLDALVVQVSPNCGT